MRKAIDYDMRGSLGAGAGRPGRYLAIAGIALLVGMTACSDGEGEGEVPDFPDSPAQVEEEAEDVICNAPVFVSDGVRTEVRTAMQAYLSNMTGIDEADVAVVKPDDLGSYGGSLGALFDRGGLVVIARPTGERFDEIRAQYDIFERMPFDATQDVLLFACDNRGSAYVLYAGGPAEGEEASDYYRRRIYNFFRWIRHDRQESGGGATRAATVSDGRRGAIGWNEGERICQNFEIRMDNAVYSKGSASYALAASGSVDVAYHVVPIYSYEVNRGMAGDYYIVEADITVHNGDLYRPLVSRGSLGNVFIGGYFLRAMDMTTGLKRQASPQRLSYSYAWEPTPVSTREGSFLCQYQCDLDGPLSYGRGLRDGEVGFDCAIRGQRNWETGHIALDVRSGGTDDVTYAYDVLEIDFSKAPTNYDYLNEAIPEVARQDFGTHQTWVWHVSTGQDGIVDYGEAKFALTTEMSLQLGSYYYRLFGDKGEDTWDVPAISSTVNITPPDRTPFGIVSLENRHKGPMTDFSVVRLAAEGSHTAAVGIPVERIAPGETARFALAEGRYDIRYAVTDSATMSTDVVMEKKAVAVSSGRTEAAGTVSLTSDDFSVAPAEFPGLNTYTDGGNPLKK